MIFSRSNLRIFSLVLGLVCLIVLVNTTLSLQRAETIRQAVQQLNSLAFVDSDNLDLTIPEVHFAYAWHLQRRGLFEDAVEAYSKTELESSDAMRKLIFYNMGNLYLEQAILLTESMGIDRAMALADVAKDMYESALKIDPGFWNAKYNLEAAQRLSRDLPLGRLSDSDEEAEGSKELWSAMPGFPIGLP